MNPAMDTQQSPMPPEARARALLERVRAYAMPNGAPRETRVAFRETARIRSGPAASWNALSAEQWIDARTLEFRWEARMRTAPLVSLHVVDAFERGAGELTVRALGRIKVAEFRGPLADKGELMRLLATFPQCPMAFAEHPWLTWTSPAESVLRVECRTPTTSAIVDYEVTAGGQIESARASDRPRQVGRSFVETPWRARGIDYREFGALRVPTRTEASWDLGTQGTFVYYEGTISSVELVTSSASG